MLDGLEQISLRRKIMILSPVSLSCQLGRTCWVIWETVHPWFQTLSHLCCISLRRFHGIDRSPAGSPLSSLYSFRSAMVTVSGWHRTAYQDQCPTIIARDENVCEYSVRVAKREVRIRAGSQVPGPKSQRWNRLSENVGCEFQGYAPGGRRGKRDEAAKKQYWS